MRNFITSSVLVFGLGQMTALSQTTTTTTTAASPIVETKKEDVKKPVLKGDDCPPPVPNKKPVCPKPKPKPKPKPPKPVPPCPAPCPVMPCPTPPAPAPCPSCKPTVIKQTEYVDRTVTIDTAPKNTLSFMVGVGPFGLVTDYYETADRKDEYSLRKEKEKANGLVLGVFYQYRLTPSWGIGAVGVSNRTFMAGPTFQW